MKKIKTLVMGTILGSAMFASYANASILGTYELTGGSADVTDADGADGITFSALGFNSFNQSDVTNAGAQDFIQVLGSEDVNADPGTTNLNANLEAATAANSFFSFTVTNNSGAALQLESFSVDTAYNNTYFGGYGLFSSAEGFDTTADDLINSRRTSGFNTSSSTQTTDLVTISGAGANIDSTDFLIENGDSLTFYLVGTQFSGSDTRSWEFDNISLSGIAIPEPSAVASIFGLIVFMSTIVRRRGRRA